MPKSIPQRMCTGCREHKPKAELVRVVRSPEGEVSLDLTGRKNGRGAYICRDNQCWKRAQKSHALEKALKCKLDDALLDELAALVAVTESTEDADA